MYLTSSSNLAINLLDSGEFKDIETSETRLFKPKPLIVDARKIEALTLTLYRPPKILTAADLKVAAAAIATNSEKNTAIVEKFITQSAPQSASRILAAVEEIEQASENKPLPLLPTNSVERDKQAEARTEAIDEVLESEVDQVFLNFRAEMFSRAVSLSEQERFNGKDSQARLTLVHNISNQFSQNFSEAWKTLEEDNYLVRGQLDADFSKKLVRVFQGAETPEMLVQRFNETQPEVAPLAKDDFSVVEAGALELLDKSSQVNTETNRYQISQLLVRHFHQKAKRYTEFWSDPGYLSAGDKDGRYLLRVREALEKSNSWEGFQVRLQSFMDQFLSEQAKKSAEAARLIEIRNEVEIPPVVSEISLEVIPLVEESPQESEVPTTTETPATEAIPETGTTDPIIEPASGVTPIDPTVPVQNSSEVDSTTP
jgi:hypothetical protein